MPDVDLLGVGTPVADAVQAGLVDIVSGKDVRAAIIAAWLRLEDAAAIVGHAAPRHRRPGRSGRSGCSPRTRCVRRSLQELAELYRRARFSRTPLGERDRAAAVQALSAVRGDLLGETDRCRRRFGCVERWPTRWT